MRQTLYISRTNDAQRREQHHSRGAVLVIIVIIVITHYHGLSARSSLMLVQLSSIAPDEKTDSSK